MGYILCLQHKTNCNCVVPSNDSKHYINPCPSKSGECHTLSYYVSGQGKNKLASNTTFYFVPGQQYTLGNVWNLILTSSNISNLCLVGNSSSESSQVTTVSCNTSCTYMDITNSNIENGVENITNTSAYAGGIDIYFITTSSIHIHFQNVTLQDNIGYDGGNVAIYYVPNDS